MPDGVTVQITGLNELREQILDMARALSPDAIEPILLRHAQTVAEEARRRVPVQPGAKGGTLRRSIICRLLGRSQKNPAPALVGVDVKTDPTGELVKYARLVEYGGGERVAKKGRYAGRRFGTMPKQPFLRPAYNAKKREVLEGISRDIGAELDKAARKT